MYDDDFDFPCSSAMREIDTEPRAGWPSIMYLEDRIKEQQKEIDRLHLLLGMKLLEKVVQNPQSQQRPQSKQERTFHHGIIPK